MNFCLSMLVQISHFLGFISTAELLFPYHETIDLKLCPFCHKTIEKNTSSFLFVCKTTASSNVYVQLAIWFSSLKIFNIKTVMQSDQHCIISTIVLKITFTCTIFWSVFCSFFLGSGSSLTLDAYQNVVQKHFFQLTV